MDLRSLQQQQDGELLPEVTQVPPGLELSVNPIPSLPLASAKISEVQIPQRMQLHRPY